MFFNSIAFALFLPIVFTIYWLLEKQKLRYQNLLLLFSSYFFYSCWDWRFLFLLVFSTFLDYYMGIRISTVVKQNERKFWFWTSIFINLGFLGVFKYYNFFADSFADALAQLGLQINTWSLTVILPVGISFYTFHGLSYVIDIYKKRIEPERNFIDYSVFVSFFPLLVAGPIERPTHLASIDIRNDKLLREEGMDMLSKYEGKKPAGMEIFLEMVGLTEEEFFKIAQSHSVSPWKMNVFNQELGEQLPDFYQWSKEGPMDRSEAEKQLDRWKKTNS